MVLKAPFVKARLAVPSERLAALSADPAGVVAITVDQYHQMLEAGVLQEGAPIELLHGVLRWKDRAAAGADPMSIGSGHVTSVGLLGELNPRLAAIDAHIRCQQPATLPYIDEPEPDGAVVVGNIRGYRDHHPGPADIWSVIEVADSSLRRDRTEKLLAYASAGIGQYLIVNLVDGQIEVFEQPVPTEGRYAQTAILKPGQKVPLRVGAEARLDVAVEDLLP